MKTKLFLLICLGLLGVIFKLFVSKVNNTQQVIDFKISSGDSFAKVYKNMQADANFNNANLVYLLGRILRVDSHIQAGVYHLDPSVTPWEFLQAIKAGKVARYKLTIIEGWRFSQVQAAVDKVSNIRHSVSKVSSENLANILGSSYDNIEGLLYPDTYYYNSNMQDLDLYKQAYQQMQTILLKYWQGRKAGLPYTNAYQALIVASLIEREAKYIDEYAKVASVIVNRLNKNMRLQIDAAVLYGVNKVMGPVYKSDLANKNPYNLYLKRGLPPTPISMPNKAAIYAALHPADTDFLYYILDKNGRHIFNKDYKSHLMLVN